MEINFATKAESNKRRAQEFLALSGGQRITRFLKLMEQVHFFPIKHKLKKKDNFVIVIPNQDELGK